VSNLTPQGGCTKTSKDANEPGPTRPRCGITWPTAINRVVFAYRRARLISANVEPEALKTKGRNEPQTQGGVALDLLRQSAGRVTTMICSKSYRAMAMAVYGFHQQTPRRKRPRNSPGSLAGALRVRGLGT